MRTILPLLLFVALMVRVDHAGAVPITFEFTGIGSGTHYRADLDQTISFQNTLIGATLVTDTDALLNPSPNLLRYDFGAVTGSFAVAGYSMGEFANALYLFQNTEQAVPIIGFGDSVEFDIFGLWTTSLAGYDMQSALATTAGSIYFPGTATIALANGSYVTLTEMHGFSNVHPSLTATLSDPISVPEPASAWLFLAGLLGVATRRLRFGSGASAVGSTVQAPNTTPITSSRSVPVP